MPALIIISDETIKFSLNIGIEWYNLLISAGGAGFGLIAEFPHR